MSNARNLSNLLEAGGDVKLSSLDNAPAPSKSTIDALGIAATSVTGSQASAITANSAKVTNYNQTKADIEALGIDTVVKSATAPSSPTAGDMWFDTTTGTTAMKVYSGSAWDIMSNVAFTVATGGTITTDGDYKIHTFTSSGGFNVITLGDALVTYLVAAGGGSGGTAANSNNRSGGGGGAGGYITGSATPSLGTNTVTVGAGGAASVGYYTTGNAGNNSSALGTTALGGGRGGTGNGTNGGSGGSGGGGGAGSNSSGYGTGTAGQGNRGGTSYPANSTNGASGGSGGGAGGVGINGCSGVACFTAGGAGAINNITGSNVTYCVGGNSGSTQSASAPNSGNGGWAGGSSSIAGGSGVVIIRYQYQQETIWHIMQKQKIVLSLK